MAVVPRVESPEPLRLTDSDRVRTTIATFEAKAFHSKLEMAEFGRLLTGREPCRSLRSNQETLISLNGKARACSLKAKPQAD